MAHGWHMGSSGPGAGFHWQPMASPRLQPELEGTGGGGEPGHQDGLGAGGASPEPAAVP